MRCHVTPSEYQPMHSCGAVSLTPNTGVQRSAPNCFDEPLNAPVSSHKSKGAFNVSSYRRVLLDRRPELLHHRKAVGKAWEGHRNEVRKGYFTTLPAAVSAAVNLALRDKIQTERIQSLQEAVDEMQRLKAELETAVSGMQ